MPWRSSAHAAFFYFSKTEEDILMRNELEEVARTHPTQFNLWYTLDRPPGGMAPLSPPGVSSNLRPSQEPVPGVVDWL